MKIKKTEKYDPNFHSQNQYLTNTELKGCFKKFINTHYPPEANDINKYFQSVSDKNYVSQLLDDFRKENKGKKSSQASLFKLQNKIEESVSGLFNFNTDGSLNFHSTNTFFHNLKDFLEKENCTEQNCIKKKFSIKKNEFTIKNQFIKILKGRIRPQLEKRKKLKEFWLNILSDDFAQNFNNEIIVALIAYSLSTTYSQENNNDNKKRFWAFFPEKGKKKVSKNNNEEEEGEEETDEDNLSQENNENLEEKDRIFSELLSYNHYGVINQRLLSHMGETFFSKLVDVSKNKENLKKIKEKNSWFFEKDALNNNLTFFATVVVGFLHDTEVLRYSPLETNKTILNPELMHKAGGILSELPMVHKPLDWKIKKYIDKKNKTKKVKTKVVGGGYLSNNLKNFQETKNNLNEVDKEYSRSLRSIFKKNFQANFYSKKSDSSINTINNLQKTPYGVNEGVIEFLKENYNENVELNPIYNIKVLEKITALDFFNYIREEYSHLHFGHIQKKLILEFITTVQSKCRSHYQIMFLAHIFRGFQIYFVAGLDCRGRVYLSSFLSPQYSKIARGLIGFYNYSLDLMKLDKNKKQNKKEIERLEKFYYNYDTYGIFLLKKYKKEDISKIISLKDKEAEKLKKTIQIFQNCLREIDWLSTEDYSFLLFCLIKTKTYKNFKYFPSMELDASASGIQISSLLMGDQKVSNKVNVTVDDTILPEKNRKHDIYTFILEKITKPFNKLIFIYFHKYRLKFSQIKELNKESYFLYRVIKNSCKKCGVCENCARSKEIISQKNKLKKQLEKETKELHLKENEKKKVKNKKKGANLNFELVDQIYDQTYCTLYNKKDDYIDNPKDFVKQNYPDLILTRKALKQVLMPSIYNKSIVSTRETMIDYFKEITKEHTYIDFDLFKLLSDFIYKKCEKFLSYRNPLNDVFLSLIESLSTQNLPVLYFTRNSFVSQCYVHMETEQFDINHFNKKERKRVKMQYKSEQFWEFKNKNAILPNFTHMLDSDVILLCLKELHEQKFVSLPIHDSLLLPPFELSYEKIFDAYRHSLIKVLLDSKHHIIENIIFRNSINYFNNLLRLNKDIQIMENKTFTELDQLERSDFPRNNSNGKNFITTILIKENNEEVIINWNEIWQKFVKSESIEIFRIEVFRFIKFNELDPKCNEYFNNLEFLKNKKTKKEEAAEEEAKEYINKIEGKNFLDAFISYHKKFLPNQDILFKNIDKFDQKQWFGFWYGFFF